ncbi:cell division protein FtsK [Actinorhabdospora filicis]|uniref:Cell division protein FtsK n=1 Tax=Actinorhabdospora filicis TaxID=1785913 RepID=A0A9W6SSK5_9ACTN|nr:FtsK/SpoIIIE domain-containing protein [Actinorhabdospora filicis]GLZ81691.1 cell division protein FtsK [Actinorhabdospora filicis]
MSWRSALERAVGAFREASAHLDRAEDVIAARSASLPAPDASAAELRDLCFRLASAAAYTAPGWLTQVLSEVDPDTPHRRDVPVGPLYVRVGTARPLPDAHFPALVPLLGQGHLVIDGDATDPVVAGLLQSVLLRVLASVPRVRISLVDGVTLGQAFTACAPLVAAGIVSRTATDHIGLDTILSEAEEHVRDAQVAAEGAAELPYRLIVIAGLPPQLGTGTRTRIAALAHAGPRYRVHLVLAGWRDRSEHDRVPAVDHATHLRLAAEHPLEEIAAPLVLDPAPPARLTRAVYGRLAETVRRESTLDVETLLPGERWWASSVDGLSTVVGRDERGPVTLSFDDATPHWLIGGRTGGGKTVFLLDVLYGLAARYGPRELALYLLDFKEGVSFTEFTPSDHDPTWIPQVRAVGVESDREYGVAVLAELRREMSRRATAMKRAGVTRLSELRKRRPDLETPRVLAVIDEFHVLFQGNDRLARQAVAHLEELARKGRSYGVHLILASQTISGVEALYDKKDSIFGQFPLRVALPGAKGVLDVLNNSAETITLGSAVVNHSGGVAGADRLIRFPDATAGAEILAGLRRELWERREAGNAPPVIFAGYAEQHLDDDPLYPSLGTGGRRPLALVGRSVDVGLSTVSFPLDPVPGRHIAILGPSAVGADILEAVVRSLSRQHAPGHARFLLVPLVAAADEAADAAVAELTAAGHDHTVVTAAALKETVAGLLAEADPDRPTHLVLFGGDSAAPVLENAGLADLRAVLKQGPARGVHVLGWWRGLRRFIDDLGGSQHREDVACLVALNLPGTDLGGFIGDIGLDWRPRTNRALAIDRHEGTVRLCVPFVAPGRLDEETL